MGLIFLDGGPQDGTAYDTKDLLGAPESALPQGYVWTSERRTSPRTGATAQVWRYTGDSVVPPQETPVALDEDGDVNEGSYLRRRREAAKATRKTVCEAIGMKPSRLVAIEAGTGKPITDDERARLAATLSGLEAQAVGH